MPERRKRKARDGAGRSGIERGYARAEQRNVEARERLAPLGRGERPLVVTIGAIVAGLIAASIVISYAAGLKVNGAKPPIVQILVPFLLMATMAWGMWRARYWAVLGFQVLLLLLILSASLGLAARAATPVQIAATLGLLGVSGAFFYFMVKAMARIQMPTRKPN